MRYKLADKILALKVLQTMMDPAAFQFVQEAEDIEDVVDSDLYYNAKII